MTAETFMQGSLAQTDRAEVAEVDAVIGKRLMEFNHQRLILWPDRSNNDFRAHDLAKSHPRFRERFEFGSAPGNSLGPETLFFPNFSRRG